MNYEELDSYKILTGIGFIDVSGHKAKLVGKVRFEKDNVVYIVEKFHGGLADDVFTYLDAFKGKKTGGGFVQLLKRKGEDYELAFLSMVMHAFGVYNISSFTYELFHKSMIRNKKKVFNKIFSGDE